MLQWKKNRKLLLAITGGISAYKTPELVRALTRDGFELEIVLTEEAESFVSPMVLSTLAGKRVWKQADYLSDGYGWRIPHIALAEWPDAVLVIPASAESVSRASRGEAGTLIGGILLATRSPVLFFPAMNVNMYEHPATLDNIKALRSLGYHIVEPDTGYLACGYEGKGRLPETDAILQEVWRTICPDRDLEGKRVLVTAGPTWEFLDPVRFLSNPSSGKMGYQMARTAWYRKASVTLVHGPVEKRCTHGIVTVPVVSAIEMYHEVIRRTEENDLIVKAAAVGDFRSSEVAPQKIKRNEDSLLTLSLVQNPDIALEVGKMKREDQVLVGFAAESTDLMENAMKKLARKNMDYIILNDIAAGEGSGFQSDDNRVTVISRSGHMLSLSGTKEEVAYRIWDVILSSKERPGIFE